MTATIHKAVWMVLLLCAAAQGAKQQGMPGHGGGRGGGGHAGNRANAERVDQVLQQCRGCGLGDADVQLVMKPVYTAQAESLPEENILVKIEEGLAKKVDPALIATAADVRLSYLRRAGTLVRAVPHIRSGWRARLIGSVALGLESGLPADAVQEVLERSEGGRPGRIVPAIDVGEALFRAGFSAEDTQTIMLDCMVRDLTHLEVERARDYLLSEHEKGRDFQAIYQELWVQPK